MSPNNNLTSPFSYPFLILAAGFGSRLQEKTQFIPKSLLSLNPEGTNSLTLLLNMLNQFNTPNIYITGGHAFDELKHAIKTRFDKITSIELIDARPSFSKGALYSFLSAENKLSSSQLFWLIPADTLFIPLFFHWFHTQQYPSNKIHLFLRSSIITELEFMQIFNTWRENPSNSGKIPFLPYMFPLMGLPGMIFSSAKRCQVEGGKKVIDIFPYIENFPTFLQIHSVPRDMEKFLDLDTLDDLNASNTFISEFWGSTNERCK